jgi:hypothetical protein
MMREWWRGSMLVSASLCVASIAEAQPIDLTPEQREKVTSHITRGPALVEPPRVAATPGTQVDGTIRTYPIPPAVRQDVPAVEPFRYFVDGPRMILVDPNTSRVVAMIEIR